MGSSACGEKKVVLLSVGEGEGESRLDAFLASKLQGISRMRIQGLIKAGLVTVEGRPQKASFRVKAGQRILVEIPPPPEGELRPEEIPLEVVYEDEDLLVVNKPPGLVVHPGAGRSSGTLVNALLAYAPEIATVGSPLRPGIVHRLDKDTSGLLVVARNDESYHSLSAQIKERKVARTYLALVHGDLTQEAGTIEAPIGRHRQFRRRMAVVPTGRRAITHYRVLERFGEYTFVEVSLETGRTHQIRVHFSHIGHPVVGDPVYGRRRNPLGLARQALHAYKLSLRHPRTGEPMEFTAPPPRDLEEALERLRSPRLPQGQAGIG